MIAKSEARAETLARRTETMEIHAHHVSTTTDRDYYQAMFEAVADSDDDASPYLFVQRQR